MTRYSNRISILRSKRIGISGFQGRRISRISELWDPRFASFRLLLLSREVIVSMWTVEQTEEKNHRRGGLRERDKMDEDIQ